MIKKRKALFNYWKEEVSTSEIIRDIINMKQVIKREPTESDLKRLQAISRDKLLSVEEEVRLINQIQHDEGDIETAKEKLLKANKCFIHLVAKQYATEVHPIDELFVEGNKGLETAIYKFDTASGYKFISYAIYYIRKSIRQYLEEQMRQSRFPMDGLSERERDILRMFYGIGREKASLQEICEKYQLTRKRAIYIEQRALCKLFQSEKNSTSVQTILEGDSES